MLQKLDVLQARDGLTDEWVALLRHFADAEAECHKLLDAGLALPAYDQCIKASHTFNLLDARGVISVTERQAYILRVRELAKGSCAAWLGSTSDEGGQDQDA